MYLTKAGPGRLCACRHPAPQLSHAAEDSAHCLYCRRIFVPTQPVNHWFHWLHSLAHLAARRDAVRAKFGRGDVHAPQVLISFWHRLGPGGVLQAGTRHSRRVWLCNCTAVKLTFSCCSLSGHINCTTILLTVWIVMT